MTKEEIRKFLDDTKVYVNGKSKEIQEKLFSFGYKWLVKNSTKVSNIERPFLFICSNGYISYTSDMSIFVVRPNREITADEILSLEVTEPSYRPFRTKEECLQEMQKHQPFGWLKNECGYWNVLAIYKYAGVEKITVSNCTYHFHKMFENHTFADGTPFGIKEE